MVVLVVLIALALLAPYVFALVHKDKTIDIKQFNETAAEIGETSTGSTSKISTTDFKPADSAGHYPAKPFVVVELNTADSARLTQVRGIGPAFAMRILHYRNRLGGFHSKRQLKEVFGIDAGKYDEIKGEFKVNPRRIRKININKAEFDDLKNMPYLNFKQTNAIIEYRKQHGDYESVAEMKNVVILDSKILRKIAPYLIFK